MRQRVYMTDALGTWPRLFAVNKALVLNDGSCVVSLVEADDERVILRIRFDSRKTMRRYSARPELRASGESFQWSNSIGGGPPLEAVSAIVFNGRLSEAATCIEVQFDGVPSARLKLIAISADEN